MTAWQDVNRDSWSFTRRLIVGAGGGVGEYRTSYALNREVGQLLNGRVSAEVSLTSRRVAGAGLVCRADDHWSFLAFYTAPGPESGESTLARVSVFNQGVFTAIAVLDKPIQLNENSRFSLEFFSHQVRGEIVTGGAVYELFADCPHLPFPGHCGLVKLYGADVLVRKFSAEVADRPPVAQTERQRGVFEYDVFLCHSKADEKVVANIAEELRGRGLTYWLDAEQIQFGQQITANIEAGLQKSRYIVPCISAKFAESKWAGGEYGGILNAELSGRLDRGVIPLLLDDSEDGVPLLLRDRRRVSYVNKVEFDAFLKFLMSR